MAQSNKKTAEQQRLAEKKKQQNQLILLTVAIGIAIIALAVGLVYGLGGKKDKEVPIEGFTTTEEVTNYVRLNITYTDKKGKEHTGDVIVELDPETAPITVANFQNLVKSDFYDGLTFHRIIKGFMIQGGDPKGTGLGGSGQNIKGEFSSNGVENNISHTRGVISMARSQSYNSASSQFFIVHQDSPHLDGDYAAFGHVVYGMETVDGVANVTTNSSNKPINTVKLNYAVFVTKD